MDHTDTQSSPAMNSSQQGRQAQAQPEPLMRCCQKTNIRDCECLKPQGPCKVPEIIFTHYNHRCTCYSCEWIREAKKADVPNYLGPKPSGLLQNPTYAGNQVDDVYNAGTSGYFNDLELVYPVLAQEAPQQWGWVFQPSRPLQLRYLADHSRCPKMVKRVTLDSDGKWKAILANGRSLPLVHNSVPRLNEIYRDHGYHPKCSPYAVCGSLCAPVRVNPACYAPQRPPNELREFAADENNTTLSIGCINKEVSNEELRWLFEHFGQTRYFNRSFESNAFVQFALRRDALMAMRQLQGVPVYKCRLRISWADPTVKNQDQFQVLNGTLPVKGNKHRHPQQPQPRCFNLMPWPGNQQQQYQWPQMAYAPWPPANVVWHHVPGHQQPAQQQPEYGCQYMARPPLLPLGQLAALTYQPAGPQDGQTSRPFKLDPRAAPWKGNLKGKGPVIASSDMVPKPSQQSRDEQAEGNITSSSESHPANASTRDSQSNETTGQTSPDKRTSPGLQEQSSLCHQS